MKMAEQRQLLERFSAEKANLKKAAEMKAESLRMAKSAKEYIASVKTEVGNLKKELAEQIKAAGKEHREKIAEFKVKLGQTEDKAAKKAIAKEAQEAKKAYKETRADILSL